MPRRVLERPIDHINSLILVGLENKVKEYVNKVYDEYIDIMKSKMQEQKEEDIKCLLSSLDKSIVSDLMVDKMEIQTVLKVFWKEEELKNVKG